LASPIRRGAARIAAGDPM